MLNKLKEIVTRINKTENKWFKLVPEIEDIFGSTQAVDLIDEFEVALDTIPKKHVPHYSFIFYLALIAIIDEETELEEISKVVQQKESYRYMKIGFCIFLSGDSAGLKYEGKLAHERYKNKYEYINFFSGYAPRYRFKLSGYIQLLKLIYYVDKSSFWKLLNYDKQNIIVLCIFIEEIIPFNDDELSLFLSAEDKIRANGAFFYLMSSFSYVIKIGRASCRESV